MMPEELTIPPEVRTRLRRLRAHLREDLLPRWLLAAGPDGLLRCRLDRTWRPYGEPRATLVSQARLIYNFAVGWDVTDDPAYLDAVERASLFFIRHFMDRAQGGCHWAVGLNGAVLDDRKDAYGHAFALFGLAHAARVLRDDRMLAAAQQVREVVADHLTDAQGGLIPSATADWEPLADTRSQNPVMHWFEAQLALAEATMGRQGIREAGRTAQFVAGLLIAGKGPLPEVYDARWVPLPEAAGGRYDLGHHLEWAWLFCRGFQQGLDDTWLPHAHHLADLGLRMGWDEEQPGLFSPARPDGSIVSRGKSRWEQCETARAMLRLGLAHNRPDLLDSFCRVIDSFRSRFLDPDHGGWYDRVEADGSVPNTDKGSEWKVDYHVVGLCREACDWLRAADAEDE